MKKYAVLPCNGLDKPVGPLARELALALIAANGGEIICPVVLHRLPKRYAKQLKQLPLFVIDGCATRCASHLAKEQGLKVERKIQLTEAAKAMGATFEDSLTPGPQGLVFRQSLASRLLAEPAAPVEPEPATDSSGPVEYLDFTHDKLLFRVPRAGYYFNENDCWVRASGNRGYVGISDYMQQFLSDITFCEPPSVGSQIEQFGEAGTVESSKAAFELVSPVTGKVTAVNTEIMSNPGLINEDPYGRGWIFQMELTNFAEDQKWLLDGQHYFDIMKRKITEAER
ncbi:MAG: putative zinc-binding protein [Dehalococcoidales bacterium]|nr:putative zinc-binding protein [Dehalococcoidales bacterium]